MFFIILSSALLTVLSVRANDDGFCGLPDGSWDVVNGNAQINGNLCVEGLSVGGKKFIPPADDPCVKILYDSLGQARSARIPNCCSRDSDCPFTGDYNHFMVCEYNQCKVKQRFTETGLVVCQSDHACNGFKTSPCQKATCEFDVTRYGFGQRTSSSTSSSSWSSSSSSFDTVSLDDSEEDVKYLGNLPIGVGVCVFTAVEGQCCESTADCRYAAEYDPIDRCCKREICDGGHKCVAIEVASCACSVGQEPCEQDEECYQLKTQHVGVLIGEETVGSDEDGYLTVSAEDCLDEICAGGVCSENSAVARSVQCVKDEDNDGYPGYWVVGNQPQSCAPRDYCNRCPSGWKLQSVVNKTECDCDDTNAHVHPNSEEFLACPATIGGQPSFDADCDGYECPWDVGFLTCAKNGAGECEVDTPGWVLYTKYEDAIDQLEDTIDGNVPPKGGLSKDCNGNLNITAPVCKLGRNIGFMYALSGFETDCSGEDYENFDSTDAPEQIFVNLLGNDYDTFDIEDYQSEEALADFCLLVTQCSQQSWENCDSADFEILVNVIPEVDSENKGKACMIDTETDGGKSVPPAGYCAEWGVDCALGLPTEKATFQPGTRKKKTAPECLPSHGAQSRSIEIQQAV